MMTKRHNDEMKNHNDKRITKHRDRDHDHDDEGSQWQKSHDHNHEAPWWQRITIIINNKK